MKINDSAEFRNTEVSKNKDGLQKKLWKKKYNLWRVMALKTDKCIYICIIFACIYTYVNPTEAYVRVHV